MLKSDIRKKEVCSKSFTKTLYGDSFLVREYILKLVYHCDGGRWSEICCARDIAKKLLNRLLLLLFLKSNYPRCAVEKCVHKNFTNFKWEHLCWSFFLAKLLKGLRAFNFIQKKFHLGCFQVKFAKLFRTLILKNICEWPLLSLHVFLFTMHEKGTANNAWLEPS